MLLVLMAVKSVVNILGSRNTKWASHNKRFSTDIHLVNLRQQLKKDLWIISDDFARVLCWSVVESNPLM